MEDSSIEPKLARRPKTKSTVQFVCPRCEQVQFLTVAQSEASGGAPTCASCAFHFENGAPAPEPEQPVASCWLCSCQDFYIQKDFNRQLGFYIVAASAMIVLLVMLLTEHLYGLFLLIGIALVDMIVYHCLANVTVCYRCQSLYRGFPLNEAHAGFNLELEEKYKKQRISWLEEELARTDDQDS